MKALLRSAACASMLAFCGTAFAQEARVPPVLNPLPEAETLPRDGVFDLLGIRLGATYEETRAALTAISPGTEPGEVETAYAGVGDNRGNSFTFLYDQRLKHEFKREDGSSETITVTFTTNVNEVRVSAITRGLYYGGSAQEGSLPELLAGLTAKYGTPSWKDEAPQIKSYYWTWHNGERQSFTDELSPLEMHSDGSPARCLNDINVYEYRYGRTNHAPGCDAFIRVTTYPGRRDDLISRVDFVMYDLNRIFRNVTDTDAWVDAEFQKVIEGKTGAAPKL